jgi:hypothetical protein
MGRLRKNDRFRLQHWHVVTSTGGYYQRPLGEFLTTHVREIDIVAVEPGEQVVDLGIRPLGREFPREDADRLGRRVSAEVGNRLDDSGFVGMPNRPLPPEPITAVVERNGGSRSSFRPR